MTRVWDVAVVGGGPAGLMASGTAAGQGASTILLERNDRVGRKLAITGKGRGNLTNDCPLVEFLSRFGEKGSYLRQVIGSFFVSELREFFDSLGVPTKVERGGRVFPVSDRARDVVDALRAWAVRSGVLIRGQSRVAALCFGDGQRFDLTISGERSVSAATVVLTTGGMSYPATGSTGDGLVLARALGHNIVPVRPALVPLVTAGDAAGRLQGLSLKNVSATVIVEGKGIAREFGELIFTHFGLSGPIILTLSRLVSEKLNMSRSVEISLDLKPALDRDILDRRLQRELTEHGRMQVKGILGHLLPKKLVPVCGECVGLDLFKNGHQVRADERRSLLNWLKDFRFSIVATRPLAEAIVTAGGIDTREVDPRTMESRILPNLYLAGEVLDIDADTGGYNLHAAFATGRLAGLYAAGRVRSNKGLI